MWFYIFPLCICNYTQNLQFVNYIIWNVGNISLWIRENLTEYIRHIITFPFLKSGISLPDKCCYHNCTDQKVFSTTCPNIFSVIWVGPIQPHLLYFLSGCPFVISSKTTDNLNGLFFALQYRFPLLPPYWHICES